MQTVINLSISDWFKHQDVNKRSAALDLQLPITNQIAHSVTGESFMGDTWTEQNRTDGLFENSSRQ